MAKRHFKNVIHIISTSAAQKPALYWGLVLVFLVIIYGLLVKQSNTNQALINPNSQAQTIRFAVAQAPINLDPRYATDAASVRVNRLLYESLIDFDATFKPIPNLATWQILSSTHYRFSLKTTHHFHDGSTLTARDIAATYQSLLSLKDAPHTVEFSHIKAIQVLDENTVDFVLAIPDDFFVEKLVMGILPAKYIAQHHAFNRAPIGSGPLKFVSWQHQLLLERVNDAQKISIMEVKDPTVRVLKLIRSEVDVLQGDLPPELLRYLTKQKGVRLQSAKGTNFSYLGLNFQDPHLSQLNVRKAIAHAIDIEAILKKALVPQSRVASVILPPEHYANRQTLKPYTYNPQLAKSLLQEENIPLPLKLVYKTSTDPQRVRFATIMQAQLAEAGIALEIKSLDWGTFFEDVKAGQFQLYGLTWVGINTPDIYAKAFGSDNIPPTGFNRGHFSDSHLDALLASHDWPQATQYLYDALPVIPLWYEGQFVAMRDAFDNYQLKSDGAWDGLAHIYYRP
jgi:peptide/nickel transport system substrate-binding protein